MVKQQNGEMVNFQSLKLFKPVIRLGFCSSFYILCFYRHTLRSELLTVYRTEQIHQFTISPIHYFTNSPIHHFTNSPFHQFNSPFYQFTNFTNFTNSPIHQFHQFTKIKFWCNSGETISSFHLVKWFNFTNIYSRDIYYIIKGVTPSSTLYMIIYENIYQIYNIFFSDTPLGYYIIFDTA